MTDELNVTSTSEHSCESDMRSDKCELPVSIGAESEGGHLDRPFAASHRAVDDVRPNHESNGLEMSACAACRGERQLVYALGQLGYDFGSEAGLFSSRLGIPTVVCGPGSIDQAHKADEFVAIDQLQRCDAMMDALLDRLA